MMPGLEQLRDIRGLDAIPWWPVATGWWLLLELFLILFTLWLFLPLLLHSWRRDARSKLHDLRRRSRFDDPKQVAADLSELLRRIAMARCGRSSCAGLSGDAWLRWLESRDPNAFPWSERGKVLLRLPYSPAGDAGIRREELGALVKAAEGWLGPEARRWDRFRLRRAGEG